MTLEELTTDIITGTWCPTEVRLSADATRVAWVAAPYGAAGEHDEGAIWVAGAEAMEQARRWTYGGKDSAPRWSPDGTKLAFLSDRGKPGTAGLYVMPTDGGEADALVVRERTVSALAWSPEGDKLAFLAPDEPDEEDRRRERERDDAEVIGERWQVHRLWVIELSSRQVSRLGDFEGHLVALDWSPKGTVIAVVVRATPALDAAADSRICLVAADSADCGGGAVIELCVAPGAEDVCFAAGGDRVAFVACHEADQVSAITVWSAPAVAGCAAEVVGPTADEPACAVDVHAVDGEDRVVIKVLEGLDTRLEWCDTATGEREVLWRGSGDVAGYDVGPGPRSAVCHHAEGGPLEVWAGRPDGLRRVSDHHALLAGLELASAEDFCFTAPDGWQLDGILIRPPGAGDGPWPTVVLPHGGPYGRSGRELHIRPGDWGQWLAACGYAVLMPNYRGGMGHGQAFAASVRGDMGGAEWRDVLTAVDAAVERGIADPARLGIGGWSQGGFLTAWAVTQTDRFRAGVVGAGVTDWSMLCLTSDVPSFETALAGGPPWRTTTRRHADARSPLLHSERITTPLLILQGQQDVRVPPTQGIALYRALRGRDAPVELVTYPREPHDVRERRHQADILRRVRAWYDRWLGQARSR